MHAPTARSSDDASAIVSAPALPPFLHDRLPFDRCAVALGGEAGVDAGRRIHVVDHGPRDAPTVLMLHGNPMWSFLWRKVMALQQAKGGDAVRLVAPDLLGLGFSSHLPRARDHTLERHVQAIAAVVRALDLRDIVLAIQDWGGPIGVGVAAAMPERIAGLVIANTAVVLPDRLRGSRFHRFARRPLISDLVFRVLGFPMRTLHKVQGDPASIRGDVARAYRWPMRRMRDRVAPLALARMVPDTEHHPTYAAMRANQNWLTAWDGPTALVWGLRDPILGRALPRHRRALPNAPVHEAPDAGHFLQEEVPDRFDAAIRDVRRRATARRGA
ncbi:MAG: alpha/beta fold hydrolase [Acidobacteriota bacterium]